MAEYRTSDDIRRYDFIKLIVALVLGAIIVIMLLRGNLPRPAATPPEEQERASGIELTEATPPPEETSTIPPVTTEATEMAAPELEEPEVSEDGALALSGTGTPGTTLEIVANGEVLDTVTVGPDGTWALASELAPGDYELSARAVDADGTVLAESESTSVTVEEPEAMVAPTLEEPEVGDDGALALSGTGTPGATLEIVANGEVLDTVTVGPDGTWALASELAPGDYDLSARAVDADGAVLAESDITSFSIEEPEAMAAPTLEEPEVSEDGTLMLSGTGTPGSTLEVVANGEVLDTVTVGPDGTWALASELAPGDYELAVQNTGDPDSLSETVDVSVAAPQPEAAEDESTVDDTEVVCGVGEAPHGIDQGDTYVVARCEYMGLIAARTGVKLADLIAANPQIANPNLIYPGQVLNLPPRD